MAPPATFEAVTGRITALLVDCKETWPAPDYGALYRELKDRFMPAESTRFNVAQLSYDQAVECLEALQERRGEPA